MVGELPRAGDVARAFSEALGVPVRAAATPPPPPPDAGAAAFYREESGEIGVIGLLGLDLAAPLAAAQAGAGRDAVARCLRHGALIPALAGSLEGALAGCADALRGPAGGRLLLDDVLPAPLPEEIALAARIASARCHLRLDVAGLGGGDISLFLPWS